MFGRRQRRGWSESELSRRRKSDPAKIDLAARLRRDTTLTITENRAAAQHGIQKKSRQQTSSMEKEP